MPMPMSVEDRVRKASMTRSTNARRRRFQRYLREMREAGLTLVIADATPQEYRDYAHDPAAFPVE